MSSSVSKTKDLGFAHGDSQVFTSNIVKRETREQYSLELISSNDFRKYVFISCIENIDHS